MIWKGTNILIRGLTADNAYQSTNQALRSKEQSVELRNRFASSHTSQKHVVSVALHGRSLKPGLFLELVSCPNRATDGEGLRVVAKNPMVSLVELHDHIQMRKTYRRTNITATLHRAGLYSGVAKLYPLLSEDKRKTHLEKAPKGPSDITSKHYVWRKPALLITCRVLYIPTVKCAGSSLWETRSRNWETRQIRRKTQCTKI